MGRRSYSGTAVPTVLSGGIGALDLSFTVQDATGYPDGSGGPFYVTLARGVAGEEKILCDSRSGLTFTVNATGRGADGTVATSHEANSTTVEHTITKTDLDEANRHVNQTAEADNPHPQYIKTSAANAAYLAKTGKAADSELLDGLDSTQFLRSTGKAADSDLLDGLDSAAFARQDANGLVARPGTQYAYVAAEEATTSTTPTTLTTAGPALTVNVGSSGRVRLVLGGYIRGSGSVIAKMGVALTGATSGGADSPERTLQQVHNVNTEGSIETIISGLAAGSTTFTAQYWVGTAGTGYFARRRLIVEPI